MVLLALGAALLLWVALRAESWALTALHRSLEARAGLEIRSGSLDLHWFPPSLDAEGLEVRSQHGTPGRFSLRARRLSVVVGWAGALAAAAGQVRLRSVRARELHLDLDNTWIQGLAERGSTRGRDRNVRWRVGSVRIEDSLLRYENAELPLDLQLAPLEIEGEWHDVRRRLVGRVAAGAVLERSPLPAPMEVRARAGFELAASELRLLHGSVEGTGVSLSSVELLCTPRAGGWALVGRAEASAELAPLVEAGLLALPEGLDGRLEGRVQLDRSGAGTHLWGRIRDGELSWEGWSGDALQGAFDFLDGEWRVERARLAALDGNVSFEARGRWGGSLEASFEARGLHVTDAPVWPPELRLPRLVLDAEGEAAASPGSWEDASAAVRWRCRAKLPPNAGGPTGEGEGRAALRDGTLALEASKVAVPGTQGSAELLWKLAGTPSWSVDARGETRSLSATTAFLSTVSPEGSLAPMLEPFRLRGRGEWSARAQRTAPSRSWSAAATARLEEAELAGLPVRRGKAQAVVLPGRLELSQVALEGDWGQARGDVAYDLSRRRPLAAELRVDGVPVRALKPWAPVLAPFDAELSGAVKLVDGPGGLQGEGTLTATGVQWAGEELGNLRSEIRVEGNRFRFDPMVLEGEAWFGSASVAWTWGSDDAEGTVDQVEVDLDALDLLHSRPWGPRGKVYLSGPFWVEGGAPRLSLGVWAPEVHVADFSLGAVEGSVEGSPAALDVVLNTRGERGIYLEARLGLDESRPLDAALYLDGTEVEWFATEYSAVWSEVSGRVVATGRWDDPAALALDGRFTPVVLWVGARRLVLTRPVIFTLREGRARVEDVVFDAEGVKLSAGASVDLFGGDLNASLQGSLDPRLLTALWPGVRAGGRLEGEVRVAGPLEQPSWAGHIEVQDGRLRVSGVPESLSRVRARVVLQAEEAKLESFQGVLGGGGVEGRGGCILAGLGVERCSFGLQVANVRLEAPEGFRGAYEGALTLESDGREASIRGRLELLRGAYSKPFDIADFFAGGRQYATFQEDLLPVRVSLDLDVRADESIRVRNDIADLRAGGELRIRGSVLRPRVTGRLEVVPGGELTFRGNLYRVRSGSIEFLDPDDPRPFLTLTAETRVREYDIFLRAEGTLDRLEYEVTSEPALPPRDIIALLTTGQIAPEAASSGELSTTGGALSGDLVSAYFAGFLAQPVERSIQKLLGLERVRIDPLLLQGQADPTARITLGKRLPRDFFLIYSTDLGATSEGRLYQVEWGASRNLRLVAERDTLGGVGLDLRYSTRFWLGAGEPGVTPASPRPDRSPSSPGRDSGPPVVTIHLEGTAADLARELLPTLALQPGEPFRHSAFWDSAQALRRGLVQRGYVEAQVEARWLETDAGVEAIFTVEAGPRVGIVVNGVKKKDRRRIEEGLVSLWSESVFPETQYDDGAAWIREYFQNRGHYAADVRFSVDPQDDETVRVVYAVDPGPLVKVRAVEVNGDPKLETSLILRQMLTRPSTLLSGQPLIPATLREDLGAVRNLYLDHGYLDVQIQEPQIGLDPVSGAWATVTLSIEAGPQVRVESVRFEGDAPLSETELAARAGIARGRVFSPLKLDEAERKLRDALDARGYPDARVRMEARRLGPTAVEIRVQVEPGSRQIVSSIDVAGLRLTKPRVVLRELQFRPGDPLSQQSLLQSQHRLYRLGLFRSVRIEVEPAGEQPEARRVRVVVREAPPAGLTLGAGYDTEAGARGSFSLSHANLAGTYRRMALQGRASGIEQRVQWSAEDRKLAGRPVNSLLNLQWEHREEIGFTLSRKSAAVRFERDTPGPWTFFLRYNLQSVDLRDVEDPLKLLERKLQNLRLGDLGFAAIRDTRDDPFNPSRGAYGSVELRTFSRALLSDREFLRLFVQGSYHHRMRNGWILGSAVRIGLARRLGDTTFVPLSERFFAGGDSTLRGFPRDEVGPRESGVPIGGEGLLLLNQEIRIPVRSPFWATLFYDAGNVFASSGDVALDDLRHVLGAGFRIETPVGPLRLEYGHKLDRRVGESPGEIFFAIGVPF